MARNSLDPCAHERRLYEEAIESQLQDRRIIAAEAQGAVEALEQLLEDVQAKRSRAVSGYHGDCDGDADPGV